MRSQRTLPRVGISMGDPSGIGPEVLARALTRTQVRRALVPIVFGDAALFDAFPGFRSLKQCSTEGLSRITGPTACIVSRLAARDRKPGHPTRRGGDAQLRYIDAAIDAAKRGGVEALCTAPVSKEQIIRAGFPFRGHTERLAQAFGVETLMLMDGPRLRVALATNHLPIAKVAKALRPDRLVRQLLLLSDSLQRTLGRLPKIAVCALNPHAGEGGVLGREEVDILVPAISMAQKKGVRCEGPFAADGLFAYRGRWPYDAVLAMFHDQGLIPVKALDFERTVNVTLGLPLPRTSPDHGVAYGLAGKNRANSVPMEQALLKAADLAHRRGGKPKSIR